MSMKERAAIEGFFGEAAKEGSSQAFGGGLLAVWRNAESFPPRRACTFTSADGSVVVPNESEEQFARLLIGAVALHVGVEQLCEVLPLISPTPRRVVRELPPHLETLAAIWRKPLCRDDRFECYVENLTSGRVEHILVDAVALQVEDVGAGLQLTLR
jgi:hypothetical protein